MSYLYLFVFLAGLICSLGNRPQASQFYLWLSLMWMLIYWSDPSNDAFPEQTLTPSQLPLYHGALFSHQGLPQDPLLVPEVVVGSSYWAVVPVPCLANRHDSCHLAHCAPDAVAEASPDSIGTYVIIPISLFMAKSF
jgi:hypothetical protein